MIRQTKAPDCSTEYRKRETGNSDALRPVARREVWLSKMRRKTSATFLAHAIYVVRIGAGGTTTLTSPVTTS